MTNPSNLFTKRADSYARFIRLVLYSQGIRTYFLHSPLLRSGLRVLDAGCGTGAVVLALRDALIRRGLPAAVLNGFDLTPTMLDRLNEQMRTKNIVGVETTQADVLHLDGLPATWRNYDLVVSASMLEYVPRDRLASALAGLRRLIAPGGALVLFITRNNWLTRLMIERWWQSNVYDEEEILKALRLAGFKNFAVGTFPISARYLATWGHIVEAYGE